MVGGIPPASSQTHHLLLPPLPQLPFPPALVHVPWGKGERTYAPMLPPSLEPGSHSYLLRAPHPQLQTKDKGSSPRTSVTRKRPHCGRALSGSDQLYTQSQCTSSPLGPCTSSSVCLSPPPPWLALFFLFLPLFLFGFPSRWPLHGSYFILSSTILVTQQAWIPDLKGWGIKKTLLVNFVNKLKGK